MDTVLIEIVDKRAYQFLQGLEELNVIKQLDKKEVDMAQENSTAKFLGALQLTTEEHDSLTQHIETIRNEWQSSF